MKYEELAALSTEQLEAELAKRKKVKELAGILKKNPLKCESVTRIEVGYSDFEFFIRNLFGVEYESACTEETNNDSKKSYHIKGLDMTNEFDRKYGVEHNNEVEAFLFGKSKKEPRMQHLLTYLADKNYIEKGEYLVSWSW